MATQLVQSPHPPRYPVAALPRLSRSIQRTAMAYKPSPICCRCGHTFHTPQERRIDSQLPQADGQQWVMTYRCRNTKACQKRAKKD